MTAVIGKNGVGKSALFDAFGFLADALNFNNVEEACDARGRGGIDRMRTHGTTDPIEFEVYYREHGNARPITYQIAITADGFGRPYVLRERLRQRRKGQKRGQPFSFLILNSGSGVAWKEDQAGHQIDEPIEDLQSFQAFMESIIAVESGETESIDLS
ncbi:AAA family ATPase, partial [Candidatus Poribacteria bacterium]|nr:AAA family ATPase [Candidatus Poribacteria bacterium]